MASRPSKKQHELLQFIDSFIKQHGYGPSYREIMRALDYKSVSTVAIHIDGLIAHGLLTKATRSARSLEVVGAGVATEAAETPHIVWLKQQILQRQDSAPDEAELLSRALKLLTAKDPLDQQGQ